MSNVSVVALHSGQVNKLKQIFKWKSFFPAVMLFPCWRSGCAQRKSHPALQKPQSCGVPSKGALPPGTIPVASRLCTPRGNGAPQGTLRTARLHLAPQGGCLLQRGNVQARVQNFFAFPTGKILSPSKQAVKIVPREAKILSPLPHSLRQRHHLAQVSKDQKTTIKSSQLTKRVYLKILEFHCLWSGSS